MERFVEPVMEVVVFSEQDIVTTSGIVLPDIDF
jgi:hypothetical protein